MQVKSKFEQLQALAKRDAEKKADADAAKAATASKKSKGGAKKKKVRNTLLVLFA